MKVNSLRILIIALFLVLAFSLPKSASAVPVDLELVLLADVSGSLDAADFALQRDGYEAAFRDASIISRIESGAIGSIAVTLVYWSSGQSQVVGWMEIDDAASANAFADAIAAALRPSSGSTGMTAALNYGASLFANNFEGTRSVIDVSGDGAETNVCSYNDPNCVPLQNARDNALASGIDAINALWIDDRDFFGDDPADIIDAVQYGIDNVIGGPSAFSSIVQDFSEFAPAVLSKIEREITTSVPEPSTLLLLGSGLFGLGLFSRRKRS